MMYPGGTSRNMWGPTVQCLVPANSSTSWQSSAEAFSSQAVTSARADGGAGNLGISSLAFTSAKSLKPACCQRKVANPLKSTPMNQRDIDMPHA
eukprot:6618121-Alexandrium_andersonii.AAC.1